MAGLRDGLRVEDLGHELVVLDAVGGRVHRLTGAAADALRAVISGVALPARARRTLGAVGILATDDPRRDGSDPDRRAVLAASALGVSTLLLPAPGMSASLTGLSAGGSAYLIVTGAASASSAPIGELQHLTFTTLAGFAGQRHFTPSESLDVEVVLVGGGGGGGTGGGGGGEVVRRILSIDPIRHDVTVGTGGGNETPGALTGDQGGASRIVLNSGGSELVAAMGGAGGSIDGPGGASGGVSGNDGGGPGLTGAGGGGGGAGGPGGDAVGESGGVGGSGFDVTDFIVASVVYGGGGGGGSYAGVPGAGGSGGGGQGGQESGNGQPGQASTGGGGGGSSGYGGSPGRGGSGIVLVRYYGDRPVVSTPAI